MTFLNPLFLSALALISIPLLIHLLRRRRLKVVRWAAMEFLLQSQRRQRRRLRIEELILLAIRALIVALAAFSFARPVLRAIGLPLLGRNTHIYAVIVLDNSFSMGQKGPDGRTSWESAIKRANLLLSHLLQPGDSVSILLVNSHPETIIGDPSYDLRLARARLNSLKLSDGATDYQSGVRAVQKLLAQSKAPYKEIYWFSDDQLSAWKNSKSEAAKYPWREITKSARLTWISSGAPANRRDNIAVQLMPFEREVVTPHLAARIEAQVTNYGSQPIKNQEVDLVLDERPSGAAHVSLSPGASALVSFTPYLADPGLYTGAVQLAQPEHADNLPIDNRAAFVLRSVKTIPALVQDMDPGRNGGSAFYLVDALNPGGENIFTPHIVNGGDISSVNLVNFPVVIITGLTQLSRDETHLLVNYALSGGGLLLFPGSSPSISNLNAASGQDGLLPAHINGIRHFSYDNALTLNPGSIGANPALVLFKESSEVDLGRARFTSCASLHPITSSTRSGNAETLIRFSDGSPALVEKKLGLGHVILASMSADTQGSQLPLTNSYLPFIYQLLGSISSGPDSHRNLNYGEAVTIHLPLADSNRPVQITLPDGRKVTHSSEIGSQGAQVEINDTQQAGIYKAAIPGTSFTDQIAVSLPGDESNLQAVPNPAQSLMQLGIPNSHLSVVSNSAELTSSTRKARYGSEIWRPLIWAALLLLALEAFLAQKFGRRG